MTESNQIRSYHPVRFNPILSIQSDPIQSDPIQPYAILVCFRIKLNQIKSDPIHILSCLILSSPPIQSSGFYFILADSTGFQPNPLFISHSVYENIISLTGVVIYLRDTLLLCTILSSGHFYIVYPLHAVCVMGFYQKIVQTTIM